MSDLVPQLHESNADDRHETSRCRTLRAAAHELRTSLTAIRGFAELIRMDGSRMQASERDEMLGFILANVKAEQGVIDRWLADDGAETANGNGTGAPMSALVLRDHVDALIDEITPLVGAGRIRVEVPRSLRVLADEVALREVMSNLLVNAVKYSPPASPITVTSALQSPDVTVTVRSGGTIAAADLGRVFDDGYRAAGGGGRDGSGLGLAIVRDLIRGSGGRVWAEPTDEGTSFSFTLSAALTWVKAFRLFPFD